MDLFFKKYSLSWIYVATMFFSIIYSVLLISQILLNINISLNTYISFALTSFVISITCNLGGFLGGKIYYAISSMSILLAIIYNFFIVLSGASEGWTDIVSVIYFVTICTIGIGFGMLAEFIFFMLKLINKKA